MDYHSDRFKDFSLFIYRNEKLVALLPANIEDDILYSHQGLTYGGLILKTNEKTKHIALYLSAVLKFLNTKGVKLVKLKMTPKIYCQQENETVDYLLNAIDAKCYRTDVISVIHIKDKKYSKDRIAGYKRGKKNNLKVKETAVFSEFWNTILIPNLNKKHKVKPVHSLREIELLNSRFPNQIRQFNVYYEDRLVAGTTIFETPFVAHSQYISGNEEKNTLGSLDFLHMYLLENIYHDKAYFDFGTSNENEGKTINEGLLYWKEGFGAIPQTQRFYDVDTSKFNELLAIFL